MFIRTKNLENSRNCSNVELLNTVSGAFVLISLHIKDKIVLTSVLKKDEIAF